MTAPLLAVEGLNLSYAHRGLSSFRSRPPTPIVSNATFDIEAGQTVALVGESGSGKTTIARAIAGLISPSTGRVVFDRFELAPRVERRPRDVHRQIQYVFQNPDASLNPRRRISRILGRPLELFFDLKGSELDRRIEQLLDAVHLPSGYASHFPTQLSGGERQRVAIARALAAEPRLILCDEIVSALDVSVQANILKLLDELQTRHGIAYLFITHDLALVRWMAHQVVVLYQGHILERGTPEEIFIPPHQPYTAMLIDSIPEPDPTGPLLKTKETAALASDPTGLAGCPFTPRCTHRIRGVCDVEPPPCQGLGGTHVLWCHVPAGDLARSQARQEQA